MFDCAAMHYKLNMNNKCNSTLFSKQKNEEKTDVISFGNISDIAKSLLDLTSEVREMNDDHQSSKVNPF